MGSDMDQSKITLEELAEQVTFTGTTDHFSGLRHVTACWIKGKEIIWHKDIMPAQEYDLLTIHERVAVEDGVIKELLQEINATPQVAPFVARGIIVDFEELSKVSYQYKVRVPGHFLNE